MERKQEILAKRLMKLLRGACFVYQDEKELQEKIGELFAANQIVFEREVRLSRRDRIDFMVGKIGLEVKTRFSTTEIIRQMNRYAESDQLDCLVLVTTKLTHIGMPEVLGEDKPVYVVYLLGSIF